MNSKTIDTQDSFDDSINPTKYLSLANEPLGTYATIDVLIKDEWADKSDAVAEMQAASEELMKAVKGFLEGPAGTEIMRRIKRAEDALIFGGRPRMDGR